MGEMKKGAEKRGNKREIQESERVFVLLVYKFVYSVAQVSIYSYKLQINTN
jgi:hypothetical protein